MATVPAGTKFIGISPDVDLTQKRSSQVNAESEGYTAEELAGTTEWGDINGTLADQTDLQEALDARLPIEAAATTGVALTFLTDRVYGTIASPGTGNITYSATGAKVGVTNIIIHNHSVEPTFATNMKKLSGSGNYVTSVVNYIYVTYINATEVIYAISQRT